MAKKTLAQVIGDMVRRKREELGWSQQHLADLVDEAHATRISFIERGGSLPSIPKLLDICDTLDLDIGTVLKESAKLAGANGFVPSMRKVKKVARESSRTLTNSKTMKGNRSKTVGGSQISHQGDVAILTKDPLSDSFPKQNDN